jgi:hypothetical protein
VISDEDRSAGAFELTPARAEGYASPRVLVDGRVTHVAWTGLRANPGTPARAFLAARDDGNWTGQLVSPDAATDQSAAAIAVTGAVTTLILRSSLRLYTRLFD